jgi:hypothetical protein
MRIIGEVMPVLYELKNIYYHVYAVFKDYVKIIFKIIDNYIYIIIINEVNNSFTAVCVKSPYSDAN